MPELPKYYNTKFSIMQGDGVACHPHCAQQCEAIALQLQATSHFVLAVRLGYIRQKNTKLSLDKFRTKYYNGFVLRKRSSAGQSARFTSVRSWVRAPSFPPKIKGWQTATCDKAGQPNDVCPYGQVMLPSAMMFTA